MISLRNFTRRFLILLNVGLAIVFLLSCCNAFLHPDKWWIISLLAFFFPLFLVLLLVFLVFWIFVCARYALISFICLIIGWQNIHAFFAFGFTDTHFDQKDSASIRVMTWNVRRWDEFTTKKPGASGHRLRMFDEIKKYNPDIVCLQEFYEPADTNRSNILYFRTSLQMPYYFFSRDYRSHGNKYETGVIIFSKYPIVSKSQTHYNDTLQSTESLIAADIQVHKSTLRVFTTHLQSVLFKSKDFRNVEIIRNADDSMLMASKSIAKKLKEALGLRGYQADTVRSRLTLSPYPLILCGDFNDVPNSYTYFHIRGKLQDVFTAKGSGIGRTYVNISPTLRIDFILASREFRVIQTTRLNNPYSDHHPVITDLQLSEGNR